MLTTTEKNNMGLEQYMLRGMRRFETRVLAEEKDATLYDILQRIQVQYLRDNR